MYPVLLEISHRVLN